MGGGGKTRGRGNVATERQHCANMRVGFQRAIAPTARAKIAGTGPLDIEKQNAEAQRRSVLQFLLPVASRHAGASHARYDIAATTIRTRANMNEGGGRLPLPLIAISWAISTLACALLHGFLRCNIIAVR